MGSDLKRWHVRFEQTPSCGTFAGVPLLVWRVCFRSRRTPVVRAECTVLCRGHGALWVAGVVLALSPHHSCSRWHSVLALRSCSVLQSFSSSLLLCGTAFWLFAFALCYRVLALRFCCACLPTTFARPPSPRSTCTDTSPIRALPSLNPPPPMSPAQSPVGGAPAALRAWRTRGWDRGRARRKRKQNFI